MIKLTILLLLCLVGSGCTHFLRVQSNPEVADVYAVAPKSDEKKFIGKAPLQVDISDLAAMVHIPPSSRSYLKLIIESKGYDSKELMVPVGVLGAMDTLVRVKLEASKPQTDNSKLVVQYLLNAQELINKGDLDRADLELERAIQLEGLNPWSYVMRGHIYLLKKDYKKSLAAYEKALEIDPNNQMILERIVNIRKFLKEKIRE